MKFTEYKEFSGSVELGVCATCSHSSATAAEQSVSQQTYSMF